jgi:hypothetical protein
MEVKKKWCKKINVYFVCEDRRRGKKILKKLKKL